MKSVLVILLILSLGATLTPVVWLELVSGTYLFRSPGARERHSGHAVQTSPASGDTVGALLSGDG